MQHPSAVLNNMLVSFRSVFDIQAKIGDALFDMFLSPDDRKGVGRIHPLKEVSHDCVSALYNHVVAQKLLAPCLMELYGDVEHTGFYEKVGREPAGCCQQWLSR